MFLGFKEDYVWKVEEASKFIESLIIGFPTPSIFLAKEKNSQRYVVVDGQQRLKTLLYFCQGTFPNGKKFNLQEVLDNLDGLNFEQLPLFEKRSFLNATIHCIIISDNYKMEGMYYVFERLNTTGNPLTPQEIRNAIYRGSLSKLLEDLSNDTSWQKLYSEEDVRLFGQELILRFFRIALFKRILFWKHRQFLEFLYVDTCEC